METSTEKKEKNKMRDMIEWIVFILALVVGSWITGATVLGIAYAGITFVQSNWDFLKFWLPLIVIPLFIGFVVLASILSKILPDEE